jgi:hypothetical protein
MNPTPTLHISDIDNFSPVTYVTCYRENFSEVTFGIVGKLDDSGEIMLSISENDETWYAPIKYYLAMLERNMHVMDALLTPRCDCI